MVIDMTREKVKFYVERDSFGAEAMIILLSLSIVFRIIGCWGLWTDRNYLAFQISLPIFSALLMILSVWFFGRRILWVTVIPVFLGIVFFIIRSLDFESRLHTVLCILLYIVVLAVYFCTVFGILKTKWFLIPLFGLPFLYHIYVDFAALSNTAESVSFAAGMQEMGILCIMLGLLFLSLSMKKTVTEETVDLPKIKEPKVTVPAKPETEPVPPSQEESPIAAESPATEAVQTAPTDQAEAEETEENRSAD